ncbi:uncharacterized protein BO80DRAFT_17771 [Aspergillus ibericus CBS 121593]|uniref:Uncharacterized protein n=1 Tax=Aspergillus ibericus CBS 121593 TaxID=1448316 RepID=A0A395GLB8_9EURO|nr:hypothetical protein BO80DRAFT_17771 [Aspergillus ibericus CBS 121593]RAK94823.1 hypothetical protein BO80DRAFT_17771 [Aspergillus ibericus CBS 121593]
MANNSSPGYKALFFREAALRQQAEERQQQADELQRQAQRERDQGRERTRQTTFAELIQYCHNYFSRSLRAESPSHSTTGKIPPPTGKCCPLQLLPWTDCAVLHPAMSTDAAAGWPAG